MKFEVRFGEGDERRLRQRRDWIRYSLIKGYVLIYMQSQL